MFEGCESEDDHVSGEQGGVEPPVLEVIDSTNSEGRAEVNLTSTPAGPEVPKGQSRSPLTFLGDLSKGIKEYWSRKSNSPDVAVVGGNSTENQPMENTTSGPNERDLNKLGEVS